MKTGKSLQELAVELDRQAKSKKDYIADTWALNLKATGTGQVILNGVNGGLPLKPIAHQQLANTLGIPKPYYDKMLENQPDLLAMNVNRWLTVSSEKKLVRTLDGQVRAILSDSYRPLDNLDLAQAVLPKLAKLEATVLSGEVTDSRFYLKAVTERIQGVVAKIDPTKHVKNELNDIIQAGLVISNSEVGQGSLRVEALDYRLACYNGMIVEQAVRKAHLGRGNNRGIDALEDAREFYRDETRMLEDKAFFSKVTDTVGSMFSQERFDIRLNKYREAGEKKIVKEVPKVIELVTKRFGFSETESGGILNHLIQGGDLTQWGLANAVTRAAQDVDSYDRSVEMEKLGGLVIELNQNDWTALAV